MSTNLKPLVSIVIPSYNAERFIEETAAHDESETWPNIEALWLTMVLLIKLFSWREI